MSQSESDENAKSQSESNTNENSFGNTFEITSNALKLDANGKSSLELNQKEQSAEIKVGDDSIQIKNGITLACGESKIILSSSSITLKCGESSIEISKESINVKGMEINLG